jgi:hypothetical protein
VTLKQSWPLSNTIRGCLCVRYLTLQEFDFSIQLRYNLAPSPASSALYPLCGRMSRIPGVRYLTQRSADSGYIVAMEILPMFTKDSARFDLDAMPKSLFTHTNPKVAKGEKYGVLTAILHLAPSMASGRNTCPHASKGCIAACLNTAGHGGIGLDEYGLNSVQAARIQRTRYFHRDRDGFFAMLTAEIRAHVRRAARHGLRAAVRLNGTSDLPWERFPLTVDGVEYPHVFAAFPHVTFYDYTKWPMGKRARTLDIPNYSLTFSLSEREDSETRAAEYLSSGYGVAVVFDTGKGADLPATYLSHPVIDGDLTDLRFTDAPSVIVGLRAKGRAKRDDSGFVRKANI